MNPPNIDANRPINLRSSRPLRQISAGRYALAILSVGAALGVSLLLEHFHFRVPSAILLLFAVAISSWYGGPGPAALAMILSAVGFYWYFIEPVRTIYINRSEIPYFIIFAAFAALLSWFGTVRRRGEAELREQAALLNLTHDTVLVMDMEGVIKYWNRGAEERYGWAADQAVGRDVHDLLKTVFPAPLEEIKAEMARAGRWEGELVHTRKDGTELVVASRWALQRDKKGAPVSILETNNDITERKRSEKALRRLNREVMLHSRVSSLSPGRIALGYAAISILWIAFSDEVVTRLNLPPAVMTIKGMVFVFVTASLLYFTIRRLLQFVQLTSQERDETARLYRTVVESSNEGICLLDESGRISFLNGRLAAMLGRPAEELQGKRFQDFIEESHVLARRGTQQSYTDECRLRTDSDPKPWVLISRHPVLNDAGEVVQLVGTVIDITERKHAEEALRRLNRELRAISDCNQTLLRATDEQSLLDKICRIVCEEAGYRMAWVSYAEHDEAKTVRPVAWTGADEEYLASAGITWADTERGRGHTGTAIRSGESCCIQDFATDPRLAPWREGLLQRGFRSGIALPLKDENGNAFGCLSIHSEKPNAFTPEEVRLLEELAGDLAFGIVTLRSRAARQRAEQEVALLSFALNNVREAALLIDDTGRFQYANEEACRVLGCARAELLDLGVEDIDTEFQPGRWSDHWRDLKAQRSLSFESRHRTRDGRLFPVEISANYFEYGGREYNLALVRDITERKQAEEKLRQQERALRQVLDFMPDLVAEFDSDRNRLYANRPALDYFGVTLEEWRSISDPYRFYHPDDRELIAREAYTAPDNPHEFEARFRKGDGTYRWFLIRDNPVRDEGGRITRWYFAATDIEDRRRAEESLRRSEAYLAEAERIGHSGTWVWNPASGIQYWSKECYAIMGFDPAEGVPGLERFLEAVHPEDRPGLRERLQGVAREKTSYETEYRIIRPSGEVRDLHVIGHPVFDSAGNLLEYVGTSADITERKRAEEALRRSEAYLAEAQRLSHTGSWALEAPSNKWIYWSEEMFRIFGFDPQEGIPDRNAVFGRIFPEDRPRVEDNFQKSLREKVDTSDEYRFGMPDGTVKHIHLIRHPLLNDAGDVVQVVGTAIDITERRQSEEALRRSEAYLADAQRVTHTGVWAGDRNSKPLYWSEEVFRIFGFDPQQGLPTAEQALQRIHPEDFDKFQRGTIDEKGYLESEYRIVLPDGTLKYVHGSAHPVLDGAGEVVEVVGVIVDITDRKRAEEALHESETRFRTFVDHAGDALFVLDLEHRNIIDVNRAACEGLGYTREELIGKTAYAFHVDSDRAEVEAAAERAAAGGTVIDRHWHRRKDGLTFPVEVHTSLVSYGGRRFLLKVARDITDRVRAEEQRNKLRQLEADLAHIDRVSTLGELTASIAHEINQPLAGIVSSGSACLRWLARDVPELEEARDAARRIVRDGKRAGEIITRIRALTKKAVMSREELDLNQTIRDVLALVGDEAKKNSVFIRTRFADDVFPVLGDQVQLQQVVLNLVMNAIEAMSNVGDRARELVITTRNIDPDQVEVAVEDSGRGIDPQMAAKIFDSFYTTKAGGMGMGLSISRSILQAHGGRLWATARDGAGTIFYFTLPKYNKEELSAGVTTV